MMQRKNALTDTEAAESCGLKASTLRKWRLRGRGPRWRRFGRAIRYLVADLEEWQRTQPSGGGDLERGGPYLPERCDQLSRVQPKTARRGARVNVPSCS